MPPPLERKKWGKCHRNVLEQGSKICSSFSWEKTSASKSLSFSCIFFNCIPLLGQSDVAVRKIFNTVKNSPFMSFGHVLQPNHFSLYTFTIKAYSLKTVESQGWNCNSTPTCSFITGWDIHWAPVRDPALKDLEVNGNRQIGKTFGALEVNCLFWAGWKKEKKHYSRKVADPEGGVEWPAKSNFSVCVFTTVAIAGGNVLCQRSALLSVMNLQWPII